MLTGEHKRLGMRLALGNMIGTDNTDGGRLNIQRLQKRLGIDRWFVSRYAPGNLMRTQGLQKLINTWKELGMNSELFKIQLQQAFPQRLELRCLVVNIKCETDKCAGTIGN